MKIPQSALTQTDRGSFSLLQESRVIGGPLWVEGNRAHCCPPNTVPICCMVRLLGSQATRGKNIGPIGRVVTGTGS